MVRSTPMSLLALGSLITTALTAAAWRHYETRRSVEIAAISTSRAQTHAQLELQAQAEFAELQWAETREDLDALAARANRLLRQYGQSSIREEIARRLDHYLARLEEHAIEAARDFSAQYPDRYRERRAHYQHYLDHYPSGRYAHEATRAIDAVVGEWDDHDYRAIYHLYQNKPSEREAILAASQAYLATHSQGRYRTATTSLVQWYGEIEQSHDYRVTLRSGHFGRRTAWLLSRGPDLSVEIEVNGISHGPSNIVANKYDPEWSYVFPRPIRWKFGDPIHIRVYDHDYYKRLVLHTTNETSDLLAMWMLSGETVVGENRLTFESSFQMPSLPPCQ